MSGPSSPSSNDWWRCGAKVVGEPELGHCVDEPGRNVQPEAPLAGAVVVGECVVVVVEALAHRQHWHQPAGFRAYKIVSMQEVMALKGTMSSKEDWTCKISSFNKILHKSVCKTKSLISATDSCHRLFLVWFESPFLQLKPNTQRGQVSGIQQRRLSMLSVKK